MLTHNGRTQSLTIGARELDLLSMRLKKRLRIMSVEQALMTPRHDNRHLLIYKGRTQSMTMWARKSVLLFGGLKSRLRREPVEKALSYRKR